MTYNFPTSSMNEEHIAKCAYCNVEASIALIPEDHAETCEYRLTNPTVVSEGLKITDDITVKLNPETKDYKMVSEVIPELNVTLSVSDVIRITEDLNALNLKL